VVQDEASALVAPALGLAPGALAVDLAAGPGGKAGHLAALGCRVVAVERHPGRARLVAGTAARLGLAARLGTVVGDGTRPPLRRGVADGVLVDAPCSNLGSLRRRPEARWRHHQADLPRLVDLQAALVRAAAALVRPGGAVVYSVCTWTWAETDGLVDRVLAEVPELAEAPLAGPAAAADGPGRSPSRRQLWPQRDGCDGVFFVRFDRTR
jgi:16S rRNA (cytosine967-C5)-methyltransferase